jgi:CAAD domains of cyanobacterial aminoacyl-tRNA synthetase
MSDTPESTPVIETTTIDIPANPLGMNAGNSSLSKVSPDLTLPDSVKQVFDILGELPAYASQIYGSNKTVINNLALIVGIIVGAKVTLAVLSAVNEIPLLAPAFELVGLGYTGYFVYRYLLQASTRKELTEGLDDLKSEVFGQKKKDA